MKSALWGVLATIAGLFAAGLVVAVIESANAFFYPELAAKLQASEGLRAEKIPNGAIVTVLVAWCAGAVAGSFVAAFITARTLRRRSLVPAYGFGLLFVAACIANLWMIPHPTWMAFFGIAAPALLIMTTAKRTLRTFYRRPREQDKRFAPDGE